MAEIKTFKSGGINIPEYIKKTELEKFQESNLVQVSYENSLYTFVALSNNNNGTWEVLSPEGIRRTVFERCLIKHPKQLEKDKKEKSRIKKLEKKLKEDLKVQKKKSKKIKTKVKTKKKKK